MGEIDCKKSAKSNFQFLPPRLECPKEVWSLKRSEKKIKIANCNFHMKITNNVTALFWEQFSESWLDHFPFAKLAKRKVQTNM